MFRGEPARGETRRCTADGRRYVLLPGEWRTRGCSAEAQRRARQRNATRRKEEPRRAEKRRGEGLLTAGTRPRRIMTPACSLQVCDCGKQNRLFFPPLSFPPSFSPLIIVARKGFWELETKERKRGASVIVGDSPSSFNLACLVFVRMRGVKLEGLNLQPFTPLVATQMFGPLFVILGLVGLLFFTWFFVYVRSVLSASDILYGGVNPALCILLARQSLVTSISDQRISLPRSNSILALDTHVLPDLQL